MIHCWPNTTLIDSKVYSISIFKDLNFEFQLFIPLRHL